MTDNKGNSVGSRASIPLLTEYQKELIIGCVLGDGYLRKLKGRKDAFLEINHSIKAKEYVDWKYEVLKNIVKTPPKIRRQNKGIFKYAYRFFTRQHPYLTKLWKQFYDQHNNKIIRGPLNLTPLSLAVWFMDDGSCSIRGDIYLNTHQFDLKSQRYLLHALRQLGIRARLNRDKGRYRIRLYRESVGRFLEIIKGHIHPSMKYKIEKCTKGE